MIWCDNRWISLQLLTSSALCYYLLVPIVCCLLVLQVYALCVYSHNLLAFLPFVTKHLANRMITLCRRLSTGSSLVQSSATGFVSWSRWVASKWRRLSQSRSRFHKCDTPRTHTTAPHRYSWVLLKFVLQSMLRACSCFFVICFCLCYFLLQRLAMLAKRSLHIPVLQLSLIYMPKNLFVCTCSLGFN